MNTDQNDYLIFHIEGGIGKNILATAVVQNIKKAYKNHKIIVVTAWEVVWYNNPDIFRVYTFGNTPYFYDLYIKPSTIIFSQEPYDHCDYILNKKHLIEIWSQLCNVPDTGAMPRLYFNPRENKLVANLINRNKPIMMIQTHGGANQQGKPPYSWTRDLPLEVAQEVVNHYKDNYHIFHIRYENQPELPNTEWLNLPLRQVLCALQFSKKRLLIDSFAQHACSAFNLPSVVCWIYNKPEVLGYELHENVKPKIEPKRESGKYSYLEPANLNGLPEQYPYDSLELFDADELIKKISITPPPAKHKKGGAR